MSNTRNQTEWFRNWFSNKYYLDLYSHRDEFDAKRLIDLIQRTIPVNSQMLILDLACGAGRHSIELARRGFNVTGIDLSPFLISEAEKNFKSAPELNLKLKFGIKDMRKFDYREKFDIIVNLFTSFGYFENDYENFKVIENVRKSLKHEGYFVLDFLNESYLKDNLVKRSVDKFGEFKVEQTRSIQSGFVIKKIVIKKADETKIYYEKLRLFSDKELTSVFRKCGFRILKRKGDYFGSAYNPKSSKRLIYFVQKN
ncbi:MAG: class I SAM-dependent methyltransferase [Ignavibacteriaceae bacterium]|jgi:SAM-dependent methyltransferase|nr:MAG: class I SAM-dependent methyltransferase [Chlorobiota bacterium]KXK02391.1 MAG: SAM-dependent methyltransferase [Chlorobi bacterium OLB4]MBV6397991.1 Ubiquinone biosynthesis O-methyltransferase [Ignavibacteria bacterium]MCC6886438.1 class I SAM-dependent methyltransferase [Ignavibacteriales bacterium]MCE7952486.1 class I SAM-dependent methyltransferase [Chlorobi bacterium CHB7]MDL1886602.1 class I SAM-dependent methyltransferase [Ignavibacteria bacterium CHB1]MEB2329679.1 class I SAM-d